MSCILLSVFLIARKPDGVSHEEAAATLLPAFRAYTALHYQLNIKPGEVMLFCAPHFV
jgi:NADPH:quinone reductase-like Zn-dependent oxidoreductase